MNNCVQLCISAFSMSQQSPWIKLNLCVMFPFFFFLHIFLYVYTGCRTYIIGYNDCFCTYFCMYIQVQPYFLHPSFYCFCTYFCMYIQGISHILFINAGFMRHVIKKKHYRKGGTDSFMSLDNKEERLYICCPLLGLQTSFLICGCLILTGEFIDQPLVFSLYSLSPIFFLRIFSAPFWSALIYRPVLL